MTNRLIRYYGTIQPYGIPTAIGIPLTLITLPLLAYSIYTVHIDNFIKFGGILGAAFWILIIYLILLIYKYRQKPWSFWQKFVWWQMIIASPIFAIITGAFYFGVLYPIWATLVWIYENSTPSAWLALFIGIVTLTIGAALFLFRLRARALYGATEVMAGVLVATHRSYSVPDLTTILDTGFLLFLLTAGVYLVVRGLDNVHVGVTKEPRDAIYLYLLEWWKKIGDQNTRNPQANGEPPSNDILAPINKNADSSE